MLMSSPKGGAFIKSWLYINIIGWLCNKLYLNYTVVIGKDFLPEQFDANEIYESKCFHIEFSKGYYYCNIAKRWKHCKEADMYSLIKILEVEKAPKIAGITSSSAAPWVTSLLPIPLTNLSSLLPLFESNTYLIIIKTEIQVFSNFWTTLLKLSLSISFD